MGYLVFVKGRKSRKLFSDRFAIISSTLYSTSLCFTIGLHLFLLLQDKSSAIIISTVIIGAIIGTCIGALETFKSLLIGYFHGMTAALMGTMLGAILVDPSLCRLPSLYSLQIEQNIIGMSVFITLLTTVTFGLLLASFRV
ncbi:hypothetical protein [Guptibacillus algicola]|uniref:hypothetical protein n=1 Tax=Guptibacillus algicola TaxID=225844 RepID=UPI001CD6F4B0|nr:hypothetical protein [Alkalihalobacillus algicola]MCA0986780.1 hypothetical protein [Alkalihalobacillus algicola]